MEWTRRHSEAVNRKPFRWPSLADALWARPFRAQAVDRFFLIGAYWAGFLLLDFTTRSFEVEMGVRAWVPTAGLSLALLTCYGLSLTPAVLIAEILSALTGLHAAPLPYALALAAVTTASLAGMSFLFRAPLKLDLRLRTLNDLIAFAIVTGGGSLLTAALRASILAGAGMRPGEEFLGILLLDWVGNAIGLTVMAPFLMVQALPLLERSVEPIPTPAVRKGRNLFEQFILLAVLVVVLWGVFFQDWHGAVRPVHLCFLPLIWAALRHGLAGATAVTLIINLTAMISVSLPRQSLQSLPDTQMLILTLSLTGLFLGAVVSQKRQALEQLSVEKAYLEQLFESAPEAIVIVDNQSRILRANAEFTRLFGYSREECLGKRVDRLIVPQEFRDEAITVTDEIMKEKNISLETVRCRKDGTPINVSILGTPIKVRGGQVAVYGIYRDVTKRLELEEQLRQAQKMEAVGRLAGGVAHDFNNLLTAILGYSELMADGTCAPSKASHYVGEIRNAADRAKSLITQLLAFSRKQVLTPKVFRLSEVVSNIEPMLNRLLGETIELETRIGSTEGSIKADPGQIEQVVVNLAVNARDAMPEGGKINMEVAECELDDEYSQRHSTLPGRYLRLRFADNGLGMQPDVRRRIFEPFFTTKEQGKGTGLGLATVYGIVKQSGGHITVTSVPGQGTEFLVYFPQVHAPAQAEVPDKAQQEPANSPATILVVEDEEGLRNLIAEVLRENGYQVLEARHGSHALLMAEAFGGPIHMLLTDVVMPEMSGRELAQRLGAQRPGVKFLFMSGYSSEAVLDAGMKNRDSAFLQKPFTPDALLRKVQQMGG